jgi:GNAT superfamily N-acetyltransferase
VHIVAQAFPGATRGDDMPAPRTEQARAALPGQDTLIAAWAALAELSPLARVLATPSAAVAVFPTWAPLNNAVLLDGDPAAAAVRLAPMYTDAGVGPWALWVPSLRADFDAPDEVAEVDGLTRDTTTLVMAADLGPGMRRHPAAVRTSIASATTAGDAPVPVADLGESDNVANLSAWVMLAEGAAVAAAWSFRRGEDCGIYAVGTVPGWRRRGLARALVEHVLAEAFSDGARTASLQSTGMGRPLYASLGFVPVGRYEEWVPAP